MKRLLFSVFMAMVAVSAAPAQENADYSKLTNAQIETQAADLHPAAFYILASRLLAEGRGQEAANWMYAGQLRYRFLITAGGEAAQNESVLFSALSEQVGRPVNEYIAGNVDEWLAAMDWALAWDADNPNGFTSKSQHAAALNEVRAGLGKLRANVEAERDNIPGQREANGLENR
ncbi:hypothetical protein FPY71_17610 [Aureimonas fodinaquatilis]|uniref:Sel1 repeat family protein n=1 Tax=Aureimonas fodinaquatilis TaxID=2565783 RepID=A0A5B0DMQ2_9HYPH|nr:hypothetical protein [Aureimonas fodinaquatilis]KAA0968147.1 hypothetical protein FPY71_17610 [Aureimonas fodinaquatilis]